MKDLDIRIEKVEADAQLQREIWRRLFDDLLAPDTDEIAEIESKSEDELRVSKMSLSYLLTSVKPVLQYKYHL